MIADVVLDIVCPVWYIDDAYSGLMQVTLRIMIEAMLSQLIRMVF